MRVTVMGTLWHKVEVNPIDVIKSISVIPDDDWIVEEDGKYLHMRDERNHAYEVGLVTKEIYEIYLAQKLLIKYLEQKPIYDKYGTAL